MKELDPSHYEFRESKSDNNDLIIAYLNKTRAGEYEGISAFDGVECNLLVVNSHRMPWHGGKLDDLLSLIPVAQIEIEEFIEELRPSKIFCFGFSLSGFPAIFMGASFGADKILVLSPELTIGFEGSRSQFHLRKKPTTFPHPDLLDYIQNYQIKNLTIIVGETQPVDLYYAARLKGIPGVNVHTIEDVGHQVFAHLRSKGLLIPFLTGELNLNELNHPRIRWGNLISTQIPETWFAGLQARKKKEYAKAEALMREVFALIPGNHIAAEDLADVLRHRAKYSEALEVIDSVIGKFPARAKIQIVRERLIKLASAKLERINARKTARRKIKILRVKKTRPDAKVE